MTDQSLSPEKTVGFGLLFPGAAQAYAGRWGLCALFLLLPWIGITVCLMLSVLVGVVGVYLPGVRDPSLLFINALMALSRPGLVSYGTLWALSLAEGYRSAQAASQQPSGRSGSWLRPVLALPVIIACVIPLIFLQVFVTKLALRAGVAAKKTLQSTEGAAAAPAP